VKAHFIKEITPRSTITVSGEALQVIDIISDTLLTVKSAPSDAGVLAALTRSHADVNTTLVGLPYKITPYVDQSSMFDTVISRLARGGCIGIFPEG
jgi:glycerol-3-phosphate O-acyltransferase/dihydroxyacetone phosphate acyltransferase